MGKDEKKQSFLSDLGRATMRGLRKCKKCGTMNGTRGYACKNSKCDEVFKDPLQMKKPINDPCKLKTSKNLNLFSVRSRDRGPEHRGFVHFVPITQVLYVDANNPITEGRCHIESCNRNKFPVTACQHIQEAKQCRKDAEPLALKQSAINAIPIPTNFKDDMWRLSLDTTGPVVQRVSKSVMVVKSVADNSNPLGYVHVSFHQTKSRKNSEHRFVCTCRAYKYASLNKNVRHCLHFYACIVAFLSDEALTQEFSYFINIVKSNRLSNINYSDSLKNEFADSLENVVDCKTNSIGTSDIDNLEEVDERSFLILGNNDGSCTPCQVEVEVVRDTSDSVDLDAHAVNEEDIDNKLEIQLQTDDSLQLRTSDGGTISVHQIRDSLALASMKRKFDPENTLVSPDLRMVARKISNENTKKNTITSRKSREDGTDESFVSFSFINWLDHVIERIEQCMHYGMTILRPAVIVLQINQSFFRCLLNRMKQFTDSKTLKPICDSIIRTDTLPLGKYDKFTYKITTAYQLTNIFSTPHKSLSTTLYFAHDKDGFNICPPPNRLNVQSTSGTPIKPREFKTVLKIGSSSCGAKHNSCFLLEWVPDLWPASEMGELTLKFDYEQYNNGNTVAFKPILPSKKTGRTNCPPLAPKPFISIPHELGMAELHVVSF